MFRVFVMDAGVVAVVRVARNALGDSHDGDEGRNNRKDVHSSRFLLSI